jgi:hypothetical protein
MCQGNDNCPQKQANDCEHHAPAKRLQERGPAESDGTKRQAFAEPDKKLKRDRAEPFNDSLHIAAGKEYGG